jgi:hypothetical protein
MSPSKIQPDDTIRGRDLIPLNESTVRRRAKRAGYLMYKSRSRLSPDNHGRYMLCEGRGNWVVLGSRFDATLEEIADFLGEA